MTSLKPLFGAALLLQGFQCVAGGWNPFASQGGSNRDGRSAPLVLDGVEINDPNPSNGAAASSQDKFNKRSFIQLNLAGDLRILLRVGGSAGEMDVYADDGKDDAGGSADDGGTQLFDNLSDVGNVCGTSNSVREPLLQSILGKTKPPKHATPLWDPNVYLTAGGDFRDQWFGLDSIGSMLEWEVGTDEQQDMQRASASRYRSRSPGIPKIRPERIQISGERYLRSYPRRTFLLDKSTIATYWRTKSMQERRADFGLHHTADLAQASFMLPIKPKRLTVQASVVGLKFWDSITHPRGRRRRRQQQNRHHGHYGRHGYDSDDEDDESLDSGYFFRRPAPTNFWDDSDDDWFLPKVAIFPGGEVKAQYRFATPGSSFRISLSNHIPDEWIDDAVAATTSMRYRPNSPEERLQRQLRSGEISADDFSTDFIFPNWWSRLSLGLEWSYVSHPPSRGGHDHSNAYADGETAWMNSVTSVNIESWLQRPLATLRCKIDHLRAVDMSRL